MNRKLYFLFFSWGTLLSLLFVFSQKLFENNLSFSVNLLWLLLMISIPLGAALYHSFKEKIRPHLPSIFSLTLLWTLIGFMLFFALFGRIEWLTILPTGETLLLRENNVFEVLFQTAALQLTAGIILFVPLWLSIGMAELALFKKLTDKNRTVHLWSYGLFISGLAFGQLLHIGIFPSEHPALLGSAVVLVGILYFFLEKAAPSWRHFFIAAITFGILVFAPGTYTFNFSFPGSYNFLPPGVTTVQLPVVHDEWRNNLRISVLEREGYLVGFYNSTFIWMAPKDDPERYSAANEYLTPLIPEGATVAVIGSGGGAQLDDVARSGAEKIYAVDVVPNLKETLTSLGSANYTLENVVSVTQDGRKFIRESDEPFDVILIPFTETILKLAKNKLEPSERLFTEEAFTEYQEKLSDGGIIIVVKAHSLYRDIIDDYITTMQAAGLSTEHILLNSIDYIAASPRAENLDTIREIFSETPNATEHISKENPAVLYDDSPYTFKNSFLTRSNLPTLSVIGALVVVLFLLLFATLRRSPHSRNEKIAAVLVGVNYTLLLLTFQLIFFLNLNRPLDAYSLGLVTFLGLIALGVLLYEKRMLLLIGSVLVAAAFLLIGLPAEAAIIGVAIVLSGGLFTTLLDVYRNNLVTLLIIDGLGAALAGVIFFVLPIVTGISVLYVTTFVITVLTLLTVYQLKSNDVQP